MRLGRAVPLASNSVPTRNPPSKIEFSAVGVEIEARCYKSLVWNIKGLEDSCINQVYGRIRAGTDQAVNAPSSLAHASCVRHSGSRDPVQPLMEIAIIWLFAAKAAQAFMVSSMPGPPETG